jgi:hypothetical protein
VVREGTGVALLSFGAHLAECLKAAEDLGAAGVSVTVADARFAKPLDTDLIAQLARHHEVLITVEQGATGGFGAHVLHHLANTGGLDRGLKVRTMTLADRFIDHASPEAMYADAGLTAGDIAANGASGARRGEPSAGSGPEDCPRRRSRGVSLLAAAVALGAFAFTPAGLRRRRDVRGGMEKPASRPDRSSASST